MSSYGMSAANCTDYPPLQSNPDIDGIGVLIGFLATSYLAFICCTVKAILDHERKSAYILGKATKKLDLWSHLLKITIISFSDQQIITGISVVIAGVTQLGWGIDAYHWETVANLAWFSAFTHIITLTALHEDPPNQTIWIIRVIAMGILLTMLIITLYPVGYMLTYTTIPANLPAWCFFHPSLPWYTPDIGYNWLYITLTFLIILFSYSSRVLRLFSVHIPQVMAPILSRIIPGKIHETLEQMLKKLKLKSMESILARMNSRHPKYRLLKSIDMVFLAGIRMFTSTYWELTWLLLALAWGTARIYVTRETGGGPTVDSLTSVLSQAGIWSFGQVVNTVLLVLPLVSFFEAFLDPPDPKILSLGAGSPNNEEARRTEQRLSLPLPTSTSPNETSIKQSIESGEWFKILAVLWYLLALNIGADLIYTFPATNGAQYFTSSGISLSILVYYIFWILLDIGLLWVPTLIFMDDHRKDTSNKKICTKRLLRVARWGTMGLMFGISVFFDYWIDAQGITWIDNLE